MYLFQRYHKITFVPHELKKIKRRAFILKGNGGVENLQLTELPAPAPKAGEVVLAVKAISINPVDVAVRANKAAMDFILQPKEHEPVIPGWDVSGVVTEVGTGVTKFNTGDEVFGMVNFPGHGRAYAEYVAAPQDQLALKPANIPHSAAAAATLAALTAYGSLVRFAKVKPDDKVLIHAAAGGVGHYAVQIAKHLGAYVIGTGSGASEDFILGLGADDFLDYRKQNFEDVVKDADVVLDSVPGDPGHIERSLSALKEGGRLISLLTFFDDAFKAKLKSRNVFGHRFGVVSDGDAMGVIAGWLEKSVLKSHVSGAFSFEDLPQTHLQVETGKTRGKIVVILD